MPARLPLFLILFLAGITYAAPPKNSPLPPPPPMAQPASLSAYRGKSIDIPLRALGRAPSQLRFFIRSQPKYGTLGPIRIIDRKTAIVTYTHDDKSGAVTDSFLFAAQANDSPVSASAPVVITISEEPAELLVASDLSFGKVFLGETDQHDFTIANAGGGILEGHMTISPPWKIVGPSDYHLERREQKTFPVVFSPDSARDFVGELNFSTGTRQTTLLRGRGVAPIDIQPPNGLELAASADRAVPRQASLTLRNVTDRTREVVFSLPSQIIGPQKLTMPANAEMLASFTTKPGFSGAFKGELTLSSGSFSQKIPISVYAVPPILATSPADTLDFGFVRPGRRYTKTFSVANSGGSSASLTAKVPTNVLIIPDPSSVVLAPGESRNFEASIEPGAEEAFADPIVIGSTGSPPVSLVIHMMKLPSKLVTPIEKPRVVAPEPENTLLTVPAQAEPSPTPTPGPVADIAGINAVKIVTMSLHEVVLTWDKPPGAQSFEIERRDIVFNQPGSPAKWVKWKNIPITEKDGVVTARFNQLPASTSQYIRIISIDQAGVPAAPSDAIRLSTITPKPFRLPWWISAILIVGGIYGAITLIRRREASARHADADRIARLEKP